MYRYNKKIALCLIIVLLFTLFFPIFNTKVQAAGKVAKTVGAHTWKNGKKDPGDQGTEVSASNFQDKYWTKVFRYPDSSVGTQMIDLAMKAANNDAIGYSQSSEPYEYYNNTTRRLSFTQEMKNNKYNPSAITHPCETDCSAFVCTIIMAVGNINPKFSSLAPVAITDTSEMLTALHKVGFHILEYSEVKGNLQVGDILWHPKVGDKDAHTEFYAGGYTGNSSDINSSQFGLYNIEIDDKVVKLDEINFDFAGSPKKVTYNGETKLSKLVFTYVGQFFDYIVNVMINAFKYSILGWSFGLESITNGAIKSIQGDEN